MERETRENPSPSGEQVVDCIYSWAHSGRKLFDIFSTSYYTYVSYLLSNKTFQFR